MYCAHCGTENEAGAYACLRCGERLYAPDTEHAPPLGLVGCPKCSASNEAHARHCWKCGASLDSAVRISPQGVAGARAARSAALESPRTRPVFTPEQRQSAGAQRDLRSTFDRGNDSGSPGAPLPEELQGWNWGAFLLDFAWGMGNRVWWAVVAGLLAWLVVFLTPMPARYLMFAILLGVKILLGLRGSQWAWEARPWQDTRQFRLVQRMWMNWGVIIVIVMVVLVIQCMRAPATPETPTS
ncbi:MAG: zinc ribbon domain-containing protein [Gemmatimonadetes bacterium]|nr:zinc ribbon domain-containing protein [Gemmatimonadota bacterium]